MPTIMCPCGTTVASRTHGLTRCEMYKEEGNMLTGGMGKLDVCGIDDFVRPEGNKESIAIRGDGCWRRRRHNTSIG